MNENERYNKKRKILLIIALLSLLAFVIICFCTYDAETDASRWALRITAWFFAFFFSMFVWSKRPNYDNDNSAAVKEDESNETE